MDKNTVIGFGLIIAVLVGFSYFNQPNKEQLAERQHYNDSIAWVQQQQVAELANSLNTPVQATSDQTDVAIPDSVKQQGLHDQYGAFAASAEGEEELITLQNELLEIQLNTKGGNVAVARLKEFSDYERQPLYLFEGGESTFALTLITANNRVLNTQELYFEPIEQSDLKTVLRLNAGDDQYLDFVYTLQPNNYMVDFQIVAHNLQTELSPAMHSLDIQWSQKLRQQEKGRTFEERYARLTYKFLADDVEEMKESKDDTKDVSNKLKWIGYKDQFFSSVLIAGDNFENARLNSTYVKEGKYMKEYSASTSVPFNVVNTDSIQLNFYFGPNDYALLKKYDKEQFTGQNLELEKLVPLGWSLFRTVNKYIIIPLFDWLTSFPIGLGLAIFLLTLIIKMALFPLTYKSFMSSAKMRVLKPQIEEITKKHPGQENAMIRQQKTMAFYKEVGVSPMAGCVPMLLTMPFLIALFWFFPVAIQLRQQSFLWANDLSTFDPVIQWSTHIPILGNHISLFCLLMSLVNVLNTKFTMAQQNTGQEQMPGMKLMMYFMPVFMFFIFNSYPAGLNYYYLVSTLITIIQTYGFRFLLNEPKLLAKLEANKKKVKPAKKKSGFMARLEEAQRQQQALLKERQKQQAKRK